MVVVVVNKIACSRNLSQMIKELIAGATAREVTHVGFNSIRIVILFSGGKGFPKGILNHVKRVVVLIVGEPLLKSLTP